MKHWQGEPFSCLASDQFRSKNLNKNIRVCSLFLSFLISPHSLSLLGLFKKFLLNSVEFAIASVVYVLFLYLRHVRS